jgi:hypothetical protein
LYKRFIPKRLETEEYRTSITSSFTANRGASWAELCVVFFFRVALDNPGRQLNTKNAQAERWPNKKTHYSGAWRNTRRS